MENESGNSLSFQEKQINHISRMSGLFFQQKSTSDGATQNGNLQNDLMLFDGVNPVDLRQ